MFSYNTQKYVLSNYPKTLKEFETENISAGGANNDQVMHVNYIDVKTNSGGEK
ncbi:hypothetical protein [Xylocopilactobacillus apicola]|uniref:hypothetical protein n=1 Tax=Xylocopilactobacillus apicola TaxID=2932184 RepID=UPI002952DDCB|nr:hypothetical protein [Xylocopilactobacillus apicola]